MAETPGSPLSEPPASEPPVTEPLVTEPPVTDRPLTEMAVLEDPVSEAPVSEGPVSESPVADAPEELSAPPAPEPTLAPEPILEPEPILAPEPILEVVAAEVTAVSETVVAFGGEAARAVTAEVAAVASGEPRVAATLEVAPLPATATGGEGGEWNLLVGKAKRLLEEADLPGQWDRLGGPLRGLGVLLGLLLVLKLYVALLDTLDDLLLLPRLLQLVGLIALLRFSVTRLTRSSDRQVILNDWKRRWDAFRGV